MISYDSLKALMAYKNTAPHATRILCELRYALTLSNALHNEHHCQVVSHVIDMLSDAVAEEGLITKAAAQQAAYL